MATPLSLFAALSDRELLVAVHRLAADERQATASLIASLAAVDARRLYLGEGCSSLFTYCTQVLHLSEHAAYGRIEAARAARRFPIILDRLAEGAITLTAIGLLAPHLTPETHRELLAAAAHKSKRAVEHLVAALRPSPDVPTSVRKLPSPAPPVERSATPSAGTSLVAPAVTNAASPVPPALLARPSLSSPVPPPPPARPAVVLPLAPARYKVQFTVDEEAFAQLRRAQALMRHRVPDGDAGAIFTHALTLLVERLEKTKLGTAKRPCASRDAASGSRAIPVALRREVWARDTGRCAFLGARGRCTETGFLEFHHVRPYAAGGAAVAGNIELRCRAHNQYEAEQFFGGPPQMARERPGLVAWTL
jgi:hypothetical protein